jgi:hypothetical protein
MMDVRRQSPVQLTMKIHSNRFRSGKENGLKIEIEKNSALSEINQVIETRG